MQTLQTLKRKIENAQDLRSVVKTMKAIAAVSIRQYERAVDALGAYRETVELGLRVVMRHRPERFAERRRQPFGNPGFVVFGSEQGLCGQFNDVIDRHAASRLEAAREEDDEVEPRVAVVGDRLIARLAARDVPLADVFHIPSSVSALRGTVDRLIIAVERWREEQGVGRIDLLYNRPQTRSTYEPVSLRLFPIDVGWLIELGETPWEGRSLPTFRMPWERLFAALVRELMAISLHRAFAESLAAENASRLASMQAAEDNIEEHLHDLESRYNQSRQRATTEELLDIISGFEALRGEGGAVV
jgi:F-type H+-transporting ATPase subunit gamma